MLNTFTQLGFIHLAQDLELMQSPMIMISLKTSEIHPMFTISNLNYLLHAHTIQGAIQVQSLALPQMIQRSLIILGL